MKIQPEKNHLLGLLGNGNIEIRALGKMNGEDTAWSGVFDCYEKMKKSLIFAMRSGFDVYTTLNPSNMIPTNTIKPYQRGVHDEDVTRIKYLPFDIDAIREKNTHATDKQVNLAVDKANYLAEWLSERGWPDPMYALSGNGAHLIYAVDLPNTKRLAKMMNWLYLGLDLRMTNENVKFDVKVRNPSRIFRCYGTINRKSGRRAKCFGKPGFVDMRLFARTAKSVKKPKQKRHFVNPGVKINTTRTKNVDIVSLFGNAGLYLKETRDAGKHFVTCPWSSEHSFTNSTDSVIWEGEYPTFYCSHDSCSNRDTKDAIAFLSK